MLCTKELKRIDITLYFLRHLSIETCSIIFMFNNIFLDIRLMKNELQASTFVKCQANY